LTWFCPIGYLETSGAVTTNIRCKSSSFDTRKDSVKLLCPKNDEHKIFLRESYDDKGAKVNVELVDNYGRFLHDQLDLYTGSVRYKYICSDCQETAMEID
jgi:hypothetical protein